jgi:hypothetical protein
MKKNSINFKLKSNKMSNNKLNFATRVTSVISSKTDKSGMNNSERIKVQALVNSRPVMIDRSVFQKTDLEREELKLAKARWNRLQVK